MKFWKYLKELLGINRENMQIYVIIEKLLTSKLSRYTIAKATIIVLSVRRLTTLLAITKSDEILAKMEAGYKAFSNDELKEMKRIIAVNVGLNNELNTKLKKIVDLEKSIDE